MKETRAMIVECPNCHSQVEYELHESEICPECGCDLQKSESGSDPELFADVDFAGIFSSASGDDWDLSASSKLMAEKLDQMDDFGQISQESECPYLRLEYNQNLFFLSGSESIIRLKMTPQDERLEHILLFMEAQRSGTGSRRQIPIREVLKRDRAFVLTIPFNPEQSFGNISICFYIGCLVDGEFSYYQFSVVHRVYDANQSGSSLRQQIVINQRISSGNASDINYRDSLGEALKNMAGKTLSVNEMIDRLNDLPPDYQLQYPVKTTWRPEDVLVNGVFYPTEKLILEYQGMTIFLFNRHQITFGRDPEVADLLVRCGQGRLGPQEYPNSTVSRKHGQILYCDDTVKYFDYSSYGTYINGRRPDGAGIPLSANALFEFGDIHYQMGMQTCQRRLPHNICQSCTAPKIKSMTFKRTDGEKECYLLIWHCCELGRVIEELADWTVFSRNNCFFIRTPEQDFYHLRPGQSIDCKGKRINVKYFEQF